VKGNIISYSLSYRLVVMGLIFDVCIWSVYILNIVFIIVWKCYVCNWSNLYFVNFYNLVGMHYLCKYYL